MEVTELQINLLGLIEYNKSEVHAGRNARSTCLLYNETKCDCLFFVLFGHKQTIKGVCTENVRTHHL